MTASGNVAPGAKYPVRVRVDDPKSGRPMAGVPVEIELTIVAIGDEDDIVIKRKAVTNSAGYATVTFDLPTKGEERGGQGFRNRHAWVIRRRGFH